MNTVGNMTRKLGWAALSLAFLGLAGCDNTIDGKLGIGELCRQTRECTSGLACVNRLCVAAPQAGKPTTSDEPINADLPTIRLKPNATPDAGGADASSDGG